MRKVAAVLLGCLMLVGCGGNDRFEGDVKFKITGGDSTGLN